MALDPHAVTVAADPPTAERVVLGERYEILGLLGAGGMGNVYKARDLELDELVALKVLRPELAGAPGALERFRREVKLARRVTHPNVARVFDIGERGGEKILTMELVDGEPLSALLDRDGALPEERAVDIAVAIAAGVGAAHAAGVVHRDLKPDNVLLAKDGRVVVTDFGIATAAAASEAARTAGGLIGTPAYMAPEQVEGAAVIDERADVYAFGAMLYEMLTGALPWRGESVIAIAAARLFAPPPDPRAARPALSPGLAATALRCMARHARDRFASMPDVAAALATVTLTPGTTAPTRAPSPFVLDARPRGGGKRIAVLPFANLGSADEEYLADGFTEELIDRLSAAPGLRVASRGVVMQHKRSDRDPRDVGRELGVQVVVEGSIRRAAGRFGIRARLLSVADGFQLWARRVDAAEQDLLTSSAELASAIAAKLAVELGAPERSERGDAEAVDLYLRARSAYHQMLFTRDPAQTVDLFVKALARAPDDPRVIAGYVMSRTRHPATPSSESDALLGEAERAVHLAPSLPDAHVALATVHFHFGREALAARPALRALALSPTSAEAHELLGQMLVEAGREEGRRHLEAALALVPGLDFSRAPLARERALAGDWDAAATLLEGGDMWYTKGRFALWRRDAEAAEELRSAFPDEPAGTLFDRVIRALVAAAARGERPDPSLFVMPPGTKPRIPAFLAQLRAEVSATLGDVGDALDALDGCVAKGAFDVSWMDRCPALDALRGEPRFAAARAIMAERAASVVNAYLAALPR